MLCGLARTSERILPKNPPSFMDETLRGKDSKGPAEQLKRDLASPVSSAPIHLQDQVPPVAGFPLKPGMILTFLSFLKINITPGASLRPRRE